jgi:uncharacterized protein YgiM (DUF1202 family)
VQNPEAKQAGQKPSTLARESAEKEELAAENPSLANKPSQGTSFQPMEPQTWESLPQTAEIRMGPSFYTPIIQLIRRGTRLKVVGRKGDWLKLELRNGSTAWIHHSLAQPEPEAVKKPLTVVAESKETSGPAFSQNNMMNKVRSAGEVLSSMHDEAKRYVSLPRVARIRSGSTIDAPVLQLIRSGTRLQVVGKKGDWLKLQLRNGSTGWIYHSLAQPEGKAVKKPLTVPEELNEDADPISVPLNMVKK